MGRPDEGHDLVSVEIAVGAGHEAVPVEASAHEHRQVGQIGTVHGDQHRHDRPVAVADQVRRGPDHRVEEGNRVLGHQVGACATEFDISSHPAAPLLVARTAEATVVDAGAWPVSLLPPNRRQAWPTKAPERWLPGGGDEVDDDRCDGVVGDVVRLAGEGLASGRGHGRGDRVGAV
jgi:hypothetical protein